MPKGGANDRRHSIFADGAVMNPWAILGIAAIWLLSLTAVGAWQNDAGQTTVRDEWSRADNKALTESNQKILELQAEVREKEREHARRMSRIANGYEKERQDEKHKTDMFVADVLAGRIMLFDPGSGVQADGSGSGQIGPTTGERDGQTHTGLSTAAAGFLFELAGECNQVVHQLDSCQEIVTSDRKIINGGMP
jgi:Bacteriophage Rz lysis protein